MITSNFVLQVHRIVFFPIIYRRMEIGRGIYNTTHLESPHYASPQETYNRLMKSSTRLYPER